MSFTDDPIWIAKREALWEQCLDSRGWAEELSRKQVRDLHAYFMTGRLTKGEPKPVGARLNFFPDMNVEAIEYVLTHNMPEGATEKDVSSLKLFFSGGIDDVPGVKTEEAVRIFRYVFGDSYSPDWHLPFLIKDESTHRQSELDPNYQFACGLGPIRWLKYEDRPRGMWYYLTDYWFSLLNYVDPILFRPGDTSHRPPNVNRKITQNKARRFLGICAHEIDITNGADEGAERRQYMQNIRDRMDALEGPPDLMTLWDDVKKSDPDEFSEF
ncbi:hypothetical protein [Marinobacter mangrovi]|uniref:hypothetical protein n=1 Tax=Marinobacter mangrovi TaxID=2803918 RepID=UPI001934AEA7|nr:hypothetical protein [Marinobacter mangrovi]